MARLHRVYMLRAICVGERPRAAGLRALSSGEGVDRRMYDQRSIYYSFAEERPWSIRLTRDKSFTDCAGKLADLAGAAIPAPAVLATMVPQALNHLSGLSGEEIRRRSADLDLSRGLQGPSMRLPGPTRPQARLMVLHISSTLGRTRTEFWSPRRTVLSALYLFAQDAPPQETADETRRVVPFRAVGAYAASS